MKTNEQLLKMAHRLIHLCNSDAPQLSAVERLCKVTYAEKIAQDGRIRKHGLEPHKDTSDHLKATHLATIYFNDLIQDTIGNLDTFFEIYSNPELKKPSSFVVNSRLFALRNVLGFLHLSQVAHEEFMKSTTALAS